MRTSQHLPLPHAVHANADTRGIARCRSKLLVDCDSSRDERFVADAASRARDSVCVARDGSAANLRDAVVWFRPVSTSRQLISTRDTKLTRMTGVSQARSRPYLLCEPLHDTLMTVESTDFLSRSTDHLRLPHRPLLVLLPGTFDPKHQEQRAASHLYFDLDAPILASPARLPHPLTQLLVDQPRFLASDGRKRACQVWTAERLHEQVHLCLSTDGEDTPLTTLCDNSLLDAKLDDALCARLGDGVHVSLRLRSFPRLSNLASHV